MNIMVTRARRARNDSFAAGDRPLRSQYVPPSSSSAIFLSDLLAQVGRRSLEPKQFDLLQSKGRPGEAVVYFAGDLNLLHRPAVSIVGTREVSEDGRRRAAKLAADLAQAGVTVVSGLARGVDAAAHGGAISVPGGRTVAVIGTPLDKAYPAEHAKLQAEIYSEHLLLSPFASGEQVFRGNFPKRNRVMAAVTDATVIVEASDTSGTLHQAAECMRLGRWLFIMRSVVDDPSLNWPSKFVGQPRVEILTSTKDVLDAINVD